MLFEITVKSFKIKKNVLKNFYLTNQSCQKFMLVSVCSVHI